MIWWGFFRQTAPATMPVHIGVNSLKKPHHIIILRFSEAVKGHAKCSLNLPLKWHRARGLFQCSRLRYHKIPWCMFVGCNVHVGMHVLFGKLYVMYPGIGEHSTTWGYKMASWVLITPIPFMTHSMAWNQSSITGP